MPRKSCASAAATSVTQQSNEWVRTSMLMSFAARRKNCLKFTSGDSRSSSPLLAACKYTTHIFRIVIRAECSSMASPLVLVMVPTRHHSVEICPQQGMTARPAARKAAREEAAHCLPSHLLCETDSASP